MPNIEGIRERLKKAITMRSDYAPYNSIAVLDIQQLLAKIASLTAERDAAVRDVPKRCWSCRYSFFNAGKECNLAHYTSESSFCLSWQWRGVEGKEDA